MSWLEEFFCIEVKRRLSQAQTEKADLQKKINDLETSLQDAGSQNNVLQSKYDVQTEELERLKEAHKKTLQALGKAVTIPDISAILSQAELNGVRKQVDPPNERHPTLDKMYGFIYEINASDNLYYAYDEATWAEILKLVHPEMKKAVGFGGTEASDCDNYANTLAVFTTLAFNKAKSPYQGAIGVAEGHYDPAISTTHAFNVIFLNNNEMLTYEPYNGKWLGKTDEVNNESLRYKVRKINFSN